LVTNPRPRKGLEYSERVVAEAKTGLLCDFVSLWFELV